jgi:hypothetical protein
MNLKQLTRSQQNGAQNRYHNHTNSQTDRYCDSSYDQSLLHCYMIRRASLGEFLRIGYHIVCEIGAVHKVIFDYEDLTR